LIRRSSIFVKAFVRCLIDQREAKRYC